MGRAGGESMRVIAARLGRSPSTISRELTRNASGAGSYRATSAHALAYHRASRPKPAKLAVHQQLRRRGGRSQTALLARADGRPAAPPIP